MRAFSRTLLDWWGVRARDLPWRRRQDPYAVWVSEVMLQQTRAAVAVSYYRRFLRAFPTVQALAVARLDEVLRCWQGLGYYARARNLHAAARQVVREGFPSDASGWQRLPGVGPYTAAAIASIVGGEECVALDGNLLRVGARLFGIRLALDDRRARFEIARRFRSLLPRGRAAELNQALMDLGSTICVPRRPRCEDCPVCRFCAARAAGIQDRVPVRRRRHVRPTRRFVAAVITDRRGRVLLVRRPPRGIWGGLWTLPFVEARSWRDARSGLSRDLGGRMRRQGRFQTEVGHAFTHFSAVCRAVAVTADFPEGTAAHLRWVRPERPGVPMPPAHRKILRSYAAASGLRASV
ncbi:MAG: A/G-specific adenine glycosylase [Armatimonadota bacterium]|nr:A/G-specific adenine glycosylase [Armatimonadota bacterium]MDR5696691.1 A/G-specific adenine glycosylase [Armatimonadota bacterium]